MTMDLKIRGFNLTVCLLCLTLLLAPLYVVRFLIPLGSLVLPTTLLEVLIWLTVISWLVGKTGEWRKLNTPPATDILVYLRNYGPVLAFLLAGVASILVSPDKRGALGIFKAYLLEPILIYVIIKDVVKRDHDSLFIILDSLFFSGLWLALLAIIQGLFGGLVITPAEMLENRAHGVYNTANALGLYLGPLAVILAGQLLSADLARRNAIVKGLALAAAVLAVILSRSTGGMLALAVSLALLLVWWWGREEGREGSLLGRGLQKIAPKIATLPWLLLIFWVIFALAAVPSLAPQASSPLERITNDTTVIRLCLWQGTMDLLKSRPIFGAGLSGFKEIYANFRTCDVELLEYPHNIFFNFWTELGLLGLLVFLWLGSRWLKQAFSEVVSSESPMIHHSQFTILKASFGFALIYWLVHGLVDVPYFKNDLALEFWVLLALLEAPYPV